MIMAWKHCDFIFKIPLWLQAPLGRSQGLERVTWWGCWRCSWCWCRGGGTRGAAPPSPSPPLLSPGRRPGRRTTPSCSTTSPWFPGLLQSLLFSPAVGRAMVPGARVTALKALLCPHHLKHKVSPDGERNTNFDGNMLSFVSNGGEDEKYWSILVETHLRWYREEVKQKFKVIFGQIWYFQEQIQKWRFAVKILNFRSNEVS